ncbi:MAG: response regulator transcription factor [Dehalococcoidia bacterium]|jgi:two-component system KDP operon response regulator KdpE|nr:response regulator transcription factor [Dehalococcoidia bacterium]MDW8009836.1 response regulator transcription factor [Chloroflexota bacterium]
MTAPPLVLAVDDEPGILRLLKQELTEQGLRVITANNGEEALRLAEEQRPDLVLLDVMLPDMSGLEVIRRLRERSDAPIILLTARDTDSDKVRGLEMGADDYVVKPFSPDEVAARIRAVLRRTSGARLSGRRLMLAGGLEIDMDRRLVLRQGEVVPLTRTEWLLLQQLAAHAGRVLTNSELLSKVWGPEYRDDVQYLRVWVSRLRRKLGDNPAEPSIIRTMPGIGYMLEAEFVAYDRRPD